MGRDPQAAKQLARSTASGISRGLVKGAVLLSLLGVGIVVPITAKPTAPAETEKQVLVAQRVDDTVGPSLEVFLSQKPANQILSKTIAPVITVGNSGTNYASRDYSRDLLEDCDPSISNPSSNGKLKSSQLCTLPWANGLKLSPRAALSLTAMNDAFSAEFGRDMCIGNSYRSYSDQQRVKRQRGYMAAAPGTSNHGWGLAIDLCSSEHSTRKIWTWLQKNGKVYGWENPAWAKPGGRKLEPWHWEYASEVKEIGVS